MNRKSKRKQNKTRRKKRGRRPRKGKKGRRGKKRLAPLASMIADPCHSQLKPGLYGSDMGFLARFKSRIALTTDGAETCGYVLWSPNYSLPGTNGVGGAAGANLISFRTANSSLSPQNTVGFPFASGVAGNPTTAVSWADPANAFVSSNTCDDARLISGCMKLTYTGPMQSASGQVAFINNIPVEAIFEPGVLGGGAASVDNLFTLANSTSRLGVDTYENILKPVDPGIERFRTDGDICIASGAAASSTIGQDALTYEPSFSGFAFRGMTAGNVALLVFELTKNIEWRPARASGIVAKPIKITGPSKIPQIVKTLDSAAPGWNNRVADGLKNAAGWLAKTAFTGVASYLLGPASTPALRYIQDVD